MNYQTTKATADVNELNRAVLRHQAGNRFPGSRSGWKKWNLSAKCAPVQAKQKNESCKEETRRQIKRQHGNQCAREEKLDKPPPRREASQTRDERLKSALQQARDSDGHVQGSGLQGDVKHKRQKKERQDLN